MGIYVGFEKENAFLLFMQALSESSDTLLNNLYSF